MGRILGCFPRHAGASGSNFYIAEHILKASEALAFWEMLDSMGLEEEGGVMPYEILEWEDRR